MMIAIVGAALLVWFGSLVFVYGLGQRNEAWRWFEAVADGRVMRGGGGTIVEVAGLDELREAIDWYGTIYYGDSPWAPPPPPAPPDDTDPGRRIKEGGWPPKR